DALLEQAREQLLNGQDPKTVLELLAHKLTNKLLHAPTAALRQAALRGDAELLRAAEKLYSSDNQDNEK
ncbi:MAG TPA: glutamyl-tRNA reductase, partial [Arenimonas sp.]|nr:glutamyl-tRNA reductase [Arenimonas sp.]